MKSSILQQFAWFMYLLFSLLATVHTQSPCSLPSDFKMGPKEAYWEETFWLNNPDWGESSVRLDCFPFSSVLFSTAVSSHFSLWKSPALCTASHWPTSSPWGSATSFRCQAVGPICGLVQVCFTHFKPVRNPWTLQNCWIPVLDILRRQNQGELAFLFLTYAALSAILHPTYFVFF